jgi:hypothetical protein
MGFESFQIILRGERTRREAEETLHSLPGVVPDPSGGFLRSSTYFVMNDGPHSIEMEVDDAAGLRISCRFILSHPPTIDVVFIAFVCELMGRLGLEATAVEAPEAEPAWTFRPGECADLTAATMRHIAIRRREWIADMGTDHAINRKELYERIILPRCAPTGDR